jgi:beta-glucosidase
MYKKIFMTAVIICYSALSFSQLPYQNPNLTPEERAKDLTARVTLREKISLMLDASKPVERLGIKGYNWWNEALHGVARAGMATVFPEPIGMAATFEPQTIFKVFTAVSDEARAKNTQFAAQGDYQRYQGLTMWTPNVNIFRDPRWGRGIETYGEDPYLTSQMGVAVVKALQGPEDTKYNKLHACAKHFAVHSGPEWNRHTFNAENISKRDLYETYLPAFKALVQDAKVKEVMCAYNRFEGEPCCGNKKLLNYILRKEWGYDGIVVADCGAIADFYKANAHATHADAATASADAVLSGTDLDCGSSYNSLMDGVERGLITEKDIDVSIVRLLKARFELGEMDKPENVSWTKIPYSIVASSAHDSLAYLTALKSMTLLLNKKNTLPLKKEGITVAVMGPNANDSVMQWGNYNGSPSHTSTIFQGIKSVLGNNAKVMYEKGCDLVQNTLFRSAFNDCTTLGGKGFSARYWNNTDANGAPVAETSISTPLNLCTSGATVFAPGVNLTGFSASYAGTFTPQQSGEVILDFYYCGYVSITIDKTEVKNFKSNHGCRKDTYSMQVEKGKKYDIQIDFKYIMGDAQLNFDLGFKQPIDNQKSIDNVKNADVIIFAGGISPSLEGEEMGVNLPGFKGGDRTDIELPKVQRDLIAALHEAGKKIIFVNCSGSPIGLENEVENCDAILQAWYPGQAGGKAVADVLFGNYNPGGRLPVTFYKNTAQLPDFENYNMQGRTYRFMQEKPLFPFGYGLSYTSFKYGKTLLTADKAKGKNNFKLVIPIKNSGKVAGEETVQVYLKKNDDVQGPVKTLRAFRRVAIPAGKNMNVAFELNDKNLEWWDTTTNSMHITPGTYQLMVGSSSDSNDLTTLTLELK